MLALLSAPRGRVSAARVAARVREHERAEVHPAVIRLPHARASAPDGLTNSLRHRTTLDAVTSGGRVPCE